MAEEPENMAPPVPEDTLGSAVKRATRFLTEFHEDVYALIRRLDQLMDGHGWEPAPDMGNRVAWGLGNSLEAAFWVVQAVSRFYVRAGLDPGPRPIVLVGLLMAPESFDEPECLVVVGQYPPDVSPRKLWDRWAGTAPALAYLVEDSGPRELPRAILDDGFLPDAIRASAFIVPLCQLVNGDVLQHLVVEPATTLAEMIVGDEMSDASEAT